MVWMTDRVLNQIVLLLLKASNEDRVASEGQWASTMDWAMREWSNRHPNTRPPAYLHADCGATTIYEWPEEEKRIASYRQLSGV